MFFYLQISSKSENSFNQFLKFIKDHKYLNCLISDFRRKTSKKFVTVLKSPHVNKTAQEQFEFRLYKKNLLISTLQIWKIFYLLKLTKSSNFPNVSIKVKSTFKHEKSSKNLKLGKVVNSAKLSFLHNYKRHGSHSQIEGYLQILEYRGKIATCVFSSVG